jgi:hypothetical protein
MYSPSVFATLRAASTITRRAHHLNVSVVLGLVAKVVVVHVPPITRLPHVPAVHTRHRAGVWSLTIPDIQSDPMSRLLSISRTAWRGIWPRATN